MLELVKCEFLEKLKRKRLICTDVLSLFFPLILAYMAERKAKEDTTEHFFKLVLIMSYTNDVRYGFSLFAFHVSIGILRLFFLYRKGL